MGDSHKLRCYISLDALAGPIRNISLDKNIHTDVYIFVCVCVFKHPCTSTQEDRRLINASKSMQVS